MQAVIAPDQFATADELPMREPSVSRALALLEAFHGDSRALGVSELARRAGLAKSTAHRLLRYLEEADFIVRSGTGYRMGMKVFRLGNLAAFCEPHGLRDTALPFLSELFVLGGRCVATLSILDGTEMICVEKIRGHDSPQTGSRAGYPLPTTNTSPGKAILAFSKPETVIAVLRAGLERATRYSIQEPDDFIRDLKATRARGYAIDHQEILLGLTGVAAPLLRDGIAYGSIALSTPTGGANIPRMASLVTRIAGELNAVLDGRPVTERFAGPRG